MFTDMQRKPNTRARGEALAGGQSQNYAWLRAVQDMPPKRDVLSYRGKVVAAALFRYANPRGIAFPSQARLLITTGFSNKKTLLSGIRELEQLGFLEVDRTGHLHRYRLVVLGSDQEVPGEPVEPAGKGLQQGPIAGEADDLDRALRAHSQAPREPASESSGAPNPSTPVTPNSVGEVRTRARESAAPPTVTPLPLPARGTDPDLEAIADELEDVFIVDPKRGVLERRVK